MDKYRLAEAVADKKCAAPRFVIKPLSTMAVEGHSARFTCRVISSAPYNVSWYHNNVELRQSVKYMKRYVGDDHTFIINRAKAADRGEFIIRADNHFGVTEEVVFLNVQAAAAVEPVARYKYAPYRISSLQISDDYFEMFLSFIDTRLSLP